MYRILFAAVLLLTACAADMAPTAPSPDMDGLTTHEWVIDVTPADESLQAKKGTSGRYPLQLGNTWKHRAHATMYTIPDEGDPTTTEVTRVTKAEITGSSQYYGRCYIVEERTITEDVGDGNAVTQTVNYRQDRAGLYEVADASVAPVDGTARHESGPFARNLQMQRNAIAWNQAFNAVQARIQPIYAMRCGRGGVLEGELTRLEYPLHRKRSWVVTDDFFTMTAHVERRVVLDLPVGRTPAWKVRIESTLFGPDDSVHFFYGRDGYLGWQLSVAGEVFDENGQPVGTVLFTDEEYLESLSIDRQGELPCTPRSPGRKTGPDQIAG